ncbi:MAG: DUF1592 domain-containing protein [Pirellulales bacterium]|nr:DUF1592 domain-containing protein [Pirellulales bacterium]MBL7182228.1 DUF1592 domain-containing protein [Pirellulales bacterium]
MTTRKKTLCLALFLLCAVTTADACAQEQDGLVLFRKHCSRCHGDKGKGSKNYPDPLQGNLSVNQLTHYIDKTMPEDNPSQVTGESAKVIAETIHPSFYSLIAQEKNKKARLELSRLTVRQMRESLADIVGSFRSPYPKIDQQRGLRAEYFDSRKFSKRSLVLERLDPKIQFSFGEASPAPNKMQPERFSIRWDGSVLPPEAGRYEFIVRTDQAVRVYVNETESTKPLIDAAVKSGNEQEYRARITLLGSRPVPLRVEFSKGRQGVAKPGQDSPNTHAFIELLWKPPHGVTEIIPERWLSPKTSPTTYVLPTSFPPDDASIGYERGSSISQEWFTATTTAGLDTADYCLKHIDELANVRRNASDRKTKLENFAVKFAEKAFRKPLSETIREQIVLKSFSAAPDLDAALRKSLLRTLTSPLFLYHEVETKTRQILPPSVIANRLSFGLWDSIPDQKLLTAAQNGQLVTDRQIRQQADRMLDDSRAKAKVLKFLLDWLHIEDGPEVVKDPSRFPEFSNEVAVAMRRSLLLFLDDVVWGKDSDYRKFFTDDTVFLNGSIAPLFDIPLEKEAVFRPVRIDNGQRAGIVTHPYMMSMLSYADSTSPIHRGVFLARNILGNVLKPPINAIAPLSTASHPDLTTRERVALQTKASVCQTCHAMINPLGFSLEEYDALGRLRATENRDGRNIPINAEGNYQPRTGKEANFYGGRELGHFLALNRDATETFVQSLFHALVKQPLKAWGSDVLEQLTDRFVSKNYSIRKLIVEIALVMTKPTKSSSKD